MVNYLLKVLNKEIAGLHQAAFLLGGFAFGSQLLALVRDRLLAHNFGAGVELDIYYAAFRVPDFIFITIGSLVSVSIIVPFLVERINHSREEGREFISQIFSCFTLVIFFTAGVVFLFVPQLQNLLFGQFTGEEHQQLVTLTRLLLLSPILMGLSGLFGSISQSHKRFFLYALSPILYNIGIIIGILFLAPFWGVMGVGVGVIIGAIFHLLIHIPFVWRAGFLPYFTLRFKPALIKKVVLNSMPRAMTLAMTHIILFALIIIASGMKEGSVSIFQFAYNLQSVPLSIIGVSYSLAALPALAAMFTKRQHYQFREKVSTSARHIIFWSLPVIVLFIVLRAQIVRVVLGTGKFDWEPTQLTAAALALFSAAVVFEGLVLLFVRSFYAMGRTATPFVVSGVGAVTAIGSALILQNLFVNNESFQRFWEVVMRLEEVEGVEVILLALAFTLGVFIKAAILWLMFQRSFPGFSAPVFRTVWQILLASLAVGSTAYIGLHFYAHFITLDTYYTLEVFLQGAFAGIWGIVAGSAVLWSINNREFRAVLVTLKQKFWPQRVVGPDPDLL